MISKKNIIFISIVAITGLFFFIILYQWAGIQQYNKDIIKLSRQIDSINLIGKDLQQLMKLNHSSSSIKFVDEVLAVGRNVKIADRPKVKTDKLDNKTTIYNFDFAKLTLRQFVEFIYQLESISPSVEIQSMDLSYADQSNDFLKLQIALSK